LFWRLPQWTSDIYGQRRLLHRTIAIRADNLRKADVNEAIATALRQQRGVNDARVSKREVLIRRGDQWFRYGAPQRVSSRE
jgi:hypothetical protein